MKHWLWRLTLLGSALALGGFLVAASGLIPIKASSGHWPITAWFLRFSMKRSVATHSFAIKVPENLSDPSLVMKGASYYEIGCRSCHGEPGRSQPRIAAHMLPTPPELAPRIRESDPKKLFYVVKHGMKFTGMPAWPSAQRDDEVWAMVAFLLEYPTLDTARYHQLAGRHETSPAQIDRAPDRHASPAAVQSCAKCHGTDGRGREIETMPFLAGQRAPYLLKALEAYARGRRHSGIMEPVATTLTSESIREITDYYSTLRPAAPRSSHDRPPSDNLSAAIQRGALIATEGIRAQRVPACIECHGPGARRGKPEYPQLAGQRAAYLELQLTLFRENRRGGSDHAHLMKPIATRLKPDQARDIAAYFASLPADAPTQR